MEILRVVSEQPWRIVAYLTGTPSTSAGDYTITRADGGYFPGVVSVAWTTPGDPGRVDLALTKPMLDGIDYQLAIAGVGATGVGRRGATPAQAGAGAVSSAEADAFGVDIDLFGELGADFDAALVAGLPSFKYDLAAAALIAPGELFHQPTEGGGLFQQVNGPGTDPDLGSVGAAVKRQWARDPRAVRGGVTVSASADGQGLVRVAGQVQTQALDKPVGVVVTQGG